MFAAARELRIGIVLAALAAAGAARAFAAAPDPSPAAVDEAADRIAPIVAQSSALPPGMLAAASEAVDPGLTIPPVFDAIPPGDGTLAAGPSPRPYASAIVDPVRNRLIVFGGYSSYYLDEVWALPLGGPPIWSKLAPTGAPPPLRIGQTAIYDPIRDRMLIFGGNKGNTNFNDVWALDFSGATSWLQIVPEGVPPIARLYASAIYDPVRDRMIVFGGVSPNERHHDVWALSLSGTATWTLIEPPGEQPPGQYLNTAIYDSVRDRLVICGGEYADSDVWAVPLSGTSPWERLTTSEGSPLPRHGHSAIYDATADRMVLFGGYKGERGNDTWAFSLSGAPAWSRIVPSTSAPPERTQHAAACDAVRARLVVFGGSGSYSSLNDTWVLPLQGSPAWSMIQPVDAPAPTAPVPVFTDSIGGIPSTIFLGQSFTINTMVRNDGVASDDGRIVVAFPALTDPADGARVSSVTLGDAPGFRVRAAGSGIEGAACEPLTASYLVAEYADGAWSEFGGETQRFDLRVTPRATGTFYVEVRSTMRAAGGPACDPANGLPSNGEAGQVDQQGWAVKRFAVTVQPLPAPGTAPVRRRLHTAVHDPVRNRMLVFGGWVGTPNAETWAFSLDGTPTWSPVLTDAGPTARYGHAAIYDPVRDRMIVFGGFDDARRNDVWALSLSGVPTWTRIVSQGTQAPPPRRFHSAIYDPVRDRMVIFGGSSNSGDQNDIWALDLADPRWTHFSYPYPRPLWRKYHGAAYDPVRDRMIVFGGLAGTATYYDDIWAFSFTGTPRWNQIGPVGGPWPAPRSGHTLTYEPARDRLWMLGGNTGAFENDAWTYSLATGRWEKAGTWGDAMSVRELHTTIADPGANRLVVYGGTDSLGRLGDTWFLSRTEPPTWRKLGASPPPPPPPDPVPTFAAQVALLPASIVIGQSFQVVVSVRNDGYPSDDGRISLGFPGLTDPGDGQWVSTAQGEAHPGLVRSPAGTTLRNVSCQPMIAPYLVADYADSSWQGFGVETHAVTFTVQPRAVGAFYVDIRATMHRAGGIGCAMASAVPDGGEGSYVDPQGWPVKRFLVAVLPPSGAAGPVFTGWGVYPGRITLGQTLTLSVSVRNDGVSSDDGRIVVGFPAFTAAGDGANVSDDTGPDLPGYRKLPAGTVLEDSTCGTVAASYLTAEYVDNDWRPFGSEQNAIQLTIRPREVGTFYIYLRSTLHTAGLGPCAYVNGVPLGGERATDQQGWTVRRYAVTVDPPPTEARPSILSVELNNTFLIVGQTLYLSVSATNLGLRSDDGRIVVGLPSFADSSDVDRVYPMDLPPGQYRERPAGSAITDSLCAPMVAGYLSVEHVDTDWQWLGLESHRLELAVIPRVPGTFFVDIRTTMRTAGAGACAYVNGVPESGDTLIVDPQGWLVRRFTITVLEEPPPDPAFVGLIGPVQTVIDLGQSFTLYATVQNQGWITDDGRICISFPSLTSVSDAGSVARGASGEAYGVYVAGDTIARADCQLTTASHLMVELTDPQWLGMGSVEQHGLQLEVTPRDTGNFVIRMRSTMRVTTAPPCVYVNESMGESTIDQQGWTVRTFTVHVNPPPPTAPVFIDNITGIPPAIALGESFTIVGIVRNDGGGSGDGRVSFAFPNLTTPGDGQWVAITGATDSPGLVKHAAGSMLNTAACGSVATGYLVADYVDDDWKQNETNTVSLQVQPRAQGTFYIDVRATMHDTTLTAGPCGYPNALPLNGVAGGTDPQGWAVKRFAVQVGPPLGPPTVSWWPITAATGGLTARTGATAVYDTRRQSMMVYGGADPGYRIDVWSLPLAIDGAPWSQLAPGGPVPLRRVMHSMIYNQRDDQLVIFAGIYDDYINDMVVLALGGAPWWFINPGYGTPPAARGGHAAVYDSLRQRMLVIGGYGGGLLHGDVWEYAPAGQGTWREIPVAGPPMPARAQHAAIYDPVRDRVVVFGGDGGTFLNDVWALHLTDPPRWEQLAPSGAAPSGRREHTAIYDPVNDRMIVYGGFDGSRRGDVWALSLGGAPAWSRLVSATVAPATRFGHTAVYDPQRHRMMVFGGSLGTGLSRELWALNLDPPTPVAISLVSSEVTSERVRLTWTGEGLANVRVMLYRAEGEDQDWMELGSPTIEAGERLVYEDRAVAPGRRYGYRLVAREGEEETELPTVWVTVPERAVLGLIGASPNPSQGELTVAFSLSDNRAATLELFDLKGRRVASCAVGGLGTGPHRIALSEGQRLPAGVYLVRLTRGADVLQAKAAIVR